MHERMNRWFALIAVCITLLCLVIAGHSFVCAAESGISVIVNAQDARHGLSNGNLFVDIYYVAQPDDTGWQYSGPFGNGVLKWNDNDELETITNCCAEIAFSRAKPIVTGKRAGVPISNTDSGSPLPDGIYLVIIRGDSLDDYIDTIRVDGRERYVTLAENRSYQFKFLPLLIILKAEDGFLEVTPKRDIVPIPQDTEPVTETEHIPDDTEPHPDDTEPHPDDTEPNPDDTEPTSEILPQTGQIWWPVAVLAITGIVLSVIGMIMEKHRKKQRRGDE